MGVATAIVGATVADGVAVGAAGAPAAAGAVGAALGLGVGVTVGPGVGVAPAAGTIVNERGIEFARTFSLGWSEEAIDKTCDPVKAIEILGSAVTAATLKVIVATFVTVVITFAGSAPTDIVTEVFPEV